MRGRLVPILIIFALLFGGTLGTWFFLSRPSDADIMALTVRNIGRLEMFEYRSGLSLASDRPDANNAAALLDAVLYNTGMLAMNASPRPDVINSFAARLYMSDGLYSFRGDFTRVEDITYLRIDEAPSFGLLNLSDVVHTWFVVPSLWDTGPVSREVRPLTGLIGTGAVFQSVTRLADERIDNRSVYHMQARIAPSALQEFIRTAVLGQGGSAREAEDAVAFVRNNVSVDTVDLWITKRGFDLYRVRAIGNVRLQGYASAHMIASIDVRRHNHSVTIKAPVVTAPSIETVLAPIGARLGMAGFETGSLTSQLPTLPQLGTRRVSGSLAAFEADTDRDGLTNLMEQVYGTDPLGPDTDGDSFKDGDEVIRGYNPLGAGKLPDAP